MHPREVVEGKKLPSITTAREMRGTPAELKCKLVLQSRVASGVVGVLGVGQLEVEKILRQLRREGGRKSKF
jgi:hypothetical protein